MKKQEVFNFMKKIKAHYQEFSMEEYIVNEWADRLKSYDIEDVYRKLDEHLKGERQSEVPKLHFITKYLKTPEEKVTAGNINVRCDYCNQILDLKKLDLHLARHRSIEYIKSREHLLNVSCNREKMMNITEVEFDRFYNKFLQELYTKIKDEEEKERLEKIIFQVG